MDHSNNTEHASINGRPRPMIRRKKPDIKAMLRDPQSARDDASDSSAQSDDRDNPPSDRPPAVNGDLHEFAVRALKKSTDRASSRAAQPDIDVTTGNFWFTAGTGTTPDDELVKKVVLTEQQRQVLKEERKRKSALKQQREEEAARKQLEEDERNKTIRAASEAERIANSPFARTLERLLKLTAKSDEDRFVLVCNQIVVDPYLHESQKNDVLAEYVKQQPFGPSIDENRIKNGLADAQRRREAWNAAVDAGMLRPSQLATARSEFAELVPGVIPAAQVGTISAPKNHLKTKIAVDLSVSLASGTDFLDYWPVTQPVHCGIIAAEDSEEEIREAIERICHAKGIDPRSLDGKLWVCPYVPNLCSDKWLETIRRFIELNELKNLVVEGSSLGLEGADQRSLSAMGNAIAPSKRLCDETGCAIQFSVHHKQANCKGWPGLSDITGVGFEEVARYWLAKPPRLESGDRRARAAADDREQAPGGPVPLGRARRPRG